MSLLPTQTPTSGGAVITRTAVTANDTFANSGRTLLLVVNGSGSSINVTINSNLSVDGNAVPDKVVPVAAGAEKVLGPFDPNIYNDPSDGLIHVDFSAITTVTAALVQIP